MKYAILVRKYAAVPHFVATIDGSTTIDVNERLLFEKKEDAEKWIRANKDKNKRMDYHVVEVNWQ